MPTKTRRGDIIARINGCTQPVVLRESERRYRIVGAAKISSKDDMFEYSSKVQHFSVFEIDACPTYRRWWATRNHSYACKNFSKRGFKRV